MSVYKATLSESCVNVDQSRNFSDLFDLSILAGREYSFCVDANRIGNFARFFNHICEPNMIPIRVLRLVYLNSILSYYPISLVYMIYHSIFIYNIN